MHHLNESPVALALDSLHDMNSMGIKLSMLGVEGPYVTQAMVDLLVPEVEYTLLEAKIEAQQKRILVRLAGSAIGYLSALIAVFGILGYSVLHGFSSLAAAGWSTGAAISVLVLVLVSERFKPRKTRLQLLADAILPSSRSRSYFKVLYQTEIQRPQPNQHLVTMLHFMLTRGTDFREIEDRTIDFIRRHG